MTAVVDPATEQVIEHVRPTSAEETDDAIARARAVAGDGES